MNPLEWANIELFGNTLLDLAIGAGAVAVIWIVLLLVRRLLRTRLQKAAEHRSLLALEIAARVVLFSSSLCTSAHGSGRWLPMSTRSSPRSC